LRPITRYREDDAGHVNVGMAVSVKLASEVRTFGSPDVVWRPFGDVSLEVVVTAAWCPDRLRGPRAEVLRLLPVHRGRRAVPGLATSSSG
jgi:hypothetical protein